MDERWKTAEAKSASRDVDDPWGERDRVVRRIAHPGNLHSLVGNMSPPSEGQKMDDYKKWKAKSKKFIAALDKIEKHLDEIEKLSRADYW